MSIFYLSFLLATHFNLLCLSSHFSHYFRSYFLLFFYLFTSLLFCVFPRIHSSFFFTFLVFFIVVSPNSSSLSISISLPLFFRVLLLFPHFPLPSHKSSPFPSLSTPFHFFYRTFHSSLPHSFTPSSLHNSTFSHPTRVRLE